MPELEVVQPRARVLRVPLGLVRVNLRSMRDRINVNKALPGGSRGEILNVRIELTECQSEHVLIKNQIT